MKHIKEFHLSTVDQIDKAPIDIITVHGWVVVKTRSKAK